MKASFTILAVWFLTLSAPAAETVQPTKIFVWDRSLPRIQQDQLREYLLSIGVAEPEKQFISMCDLNRDGTLKLYFRPRIQVQGCNAAQPWRFLRWQKTRWVEFGRIPECITNPIDNGETWMIFHGMSLLNDHQGYEVTYKYSVGRYRCVHKEDFTYHRDKDNGIITDSTTPRR